MLPHATDWHRGCSVAVGHLRSVGGLSPAKKETIQSGCYEPGSGGLFRTRVLQDGWRGGVLVLLTRTEVKRTQVAASRHSEASCSNFPSRVTVGRWVHKSDRCGSKVGRRAEQTSGAMFLTLPDQAKSSLTLHRSPGLYQPATRARPTSILLPETQ